MEKVNYLSKMEKGLSVVIPNYNGKHLFPFTLPTVYEALKTVPLPYEIIIVDDCSTDDSVAYLQKNYPNIKIFINENNSGFSVTANKGFAASAYHLIFLLNSDVKLTPNYFEPQLKYFERADTFGVMGRIVGWDDEMIQDGAKYPYFHGIKIKTSGNYLLEEEEMKDSLYSMYLSGANALISKKALEQCGGLNELFSPFYIEDYELSLRAWRMGYKCYYEHSSVCRHQTSTTIRSSSKKKSIEIIYNRNKLFLHAIHLSTAERYLYYLLLLPEVVVRMVTGRWSYLQSLNLFIGKYSAVRKSRRDLQLAAGNKKLYSVTEVADIIKASIKGKKIRRF